MKRGMVINMIDVTSIIEALLTLVVAVIGTAYTYMRSKSDNTQQLDKWVHIAVQAAEQAYKTGMTDDRKTYATEVLEKQGYKVRWGELDDQIEAAVNQLKPAQRNEQSESYMDGRGD